MVKPFFLLVSLLAAGLLPKASQGQAADSSAELRMRPIQTIPARAVVLATLPGSDTQAVLRILRVVDNALALEAKSEILAHFYFTTDSVRNVKELTGVKPGDTISLRMSGKYLPASGQYRYRVFHYRHLPAGRQRGQKE